MKLVLNVSTMTKKKRRGPRIRRTKTRQQLWNLQLRCIHRAESTIWYLNQLMVPLKPHYCWKWESLSVMSCTKGTEDAGQVFGESGWWKQTLSSSHHNWKCKFPRVWSSELGALMRSHGEFQERCLICFAETWERFWCSKSSFPRSSLLGQQHACKQQPNTNWEKNCSAVEEYEHPCESYHHDNCESVIFTKTSVYLGSTLSWNVRCRT